jgi:hypothetical protein
LAAAAPPSSGFQASDLATTFVPTVIYFYPFPIANVVIAFAPGAQDTMMVPAASSLKRS